MHLGNGAITPECAVIAFGAAGTGLALYGRAASRAGLTSDKLCLAAGLGCVTFAAQAINVPLGAGFSGHLVGGVLLATLLGPGLGAITMSLVLLLQALILGDGGLLALGANVLNMALLPAMLVQVVTHTANAKQPIQLAVISGGAVVLAALLIVVETALFRSTGQLANWSEFAARMLTAHLAIACLEATISLAVLYAASAIRQPVARLRPALIAVVGAALLAVACLPLSSKLPDGFEAAAESSHMTWLLK
jgi:cobalt/nickel transport system permease protein